MRDAIPYFAAGLLGSLVLIAPHLVAWAEPHRGRHWRSLDNALELGLTVSLIPLIESIALSTRAQRRFWRRFPVVLDTTSARTAREAGQSLVAFVNRLRKDYLTTLATLSALAFVVYGAFVGIGIVRPAGRGHQWYDVAFFGCGLVAALLYGAGSFGCMYALSLGRPRPVVAAVALALVSVPAVGWPLALAWPFPAALVSSLVSSAVYAVLAQRACRIAILDSARLNSIFS